MATLTIVSFLAALAVPLADAWNPSNHQCHRKIEFSPPNNFAPVNFTQAATLVATVKNGFLYEVTVPNSGGNTSVVIPLIHVYGSAYDMGFARGQLLGKRVNSFVTQTLSYLYEQIESAEPSWIPSWFKLSIAELGLDAALDAIALATAEWTGSYYFEELHGLSDGSGVDYLTLLRLQLMGEVTQGHCSTFGAWGAATSEGQLLQLRALDWDMDGPFRDFPLITVYHPTATGSLEGAHPFITQGMVAFVGGLSGMSASQLAISEIGVSYPDPSFGNDSTRIGYPFLFLLRDILSFDDYLENATSRLENARRTSQLILGVGDGKEGIFRGYEYSTDTLDVFTPENMRPDNDTWHWKMEDTLYWGMDWLCPPESFVLGTQLQKLHGKLTAELAIQYVVGVQRSGDVHTAVYDLTAQMMYVGFASPHGVGGPDRASARQFIQLDGVELFAHPPPKNTL